MMFINCPAYLDQEGAVRCGLPAEVRCRFTMRSTDGPLEGAMIRCPVGHYFSGPIKSLTPDSMDQHDPGTAGAGSRAGRDSLQDSHDGRSALQAFPGAPERNARRPNTAPAYYLGHPARLWITVMRPHRGDGASHHPMRAVTGGGQPPARHGRPVTGAGTETACATPTTASLPAIGARAQ
jgi:hypothetical protein